MELYKNINSTPYIYNSKLLAEDDARFVSQLRAFRLKELEGNLEVGRPRRILRALGLEDKPIRIDKKTLAGILEQHPELSWIDLNILPTALNNPVMVLKGNNYQSDKDSLWIMTPLKNKDGFYVDTIIKLKQYSDAYEITSIYPRYSIYGTLKAMERGDLLFTNKKKALRYFEDLAEKADTSWSTWSPFLKKTKVQQFKDNAKSIIEKIKSFENTISDDEVFNQLAGNSKTEKTEVKKGITMVDINNIPSVC
jgi:hypothetical protein